MRVRGRWNSLFRKTLSVLQFYAVFLFSSSFREAFAQLTSPSAETHRGSVGAYNYTYYNFVTRRPGAALVVLQTTFGDADLYVSQRDNKHQPTFAFDDFDMSSASCGIDTVEIEDLTLPVNIGVYGHPSFPFSNYTLAILVSPPAGTIDDLRTYLHDSGVSYEELPSFIDSHAPTRDADSSDELTFVDLCISLLKFLFEVLFEIVF